jgi:hypothetical protein
VRSRISASGVAPKSGSWKKDGSGGNLTKEAVSDRVIPGNQGGVAELNQSENECLAEWNGHSKRKEKRKSSLGIPQKLEERNLVD